MSLQAGRSIAFLLLFAAGLASEAAAQLPPLQPRVVASGFSLPIAIVQDPTDRTVQFVVQQGGRIRVLVGGAVQATDFLDLSASISSGGERGLLGLAFSPDYATSGRFYVNFTNPQGHTVVARFKRSANPLVADPGSRVDFRWGGASGPAFISQPFSNHNGGHLAFSPVDGYLYIGLGDGGSANDPDHRAQNPAELLGKMLRIDVSVADSDPSGYRVPADNPFVGSSLLGVRPEIWAFGLRNPWRYNFDDSARGGTGALIIADVGQGAFEEVNYEPAGRGGRNYGWRNREGAHDNVTTLPPAYTPLTDPIHEYGRSSGRSITGGFVYRGTALGTAYRGRYFFGDFVSGRIWSIALTIDPTTGEAQASNVVDHSGELAVTGNVSSFGVDADGELYFLDYSGRVVAIEASGPASAPIVTAHPAGSAVIAGQLATFSAAASGTPTPSVQWQVSTNGGASWTDIAGATSSTLTFRTAVRDNGRHYRAVFTNSAGSTASNPALLSVRAATQGDIDGDGRSDLVVWRPTDGTWYMLTSADSYATARGTQWGNDAAGDVPLLGDIDGDGTRDLILWRASTGTWFWLTSSSGYAYASAGSKQWGNAGLGDTPLIGDMDGDGKSDLIVWRASTGTWFWLTSSSAYDYAAAGSQQWGNEALGDVPFPADIDGDGFSDLAVWRASTGTWFWLTAASGFAAPAAGSKQFGNQGLGDIPHTGDIDGDGRADLIVWRASTGTWFWLPSSTGYEHSSAGSVQWGNETAGDRPVLGDFDGDGRADMAVWRASTGTWFWLTSSTGYSPASAGAKQWGSMAMGDVPMVK